MRFLRLRLTSFRGVAAQEVRFARDGVTVIHGPNEIGKSSLVEAIDLVLDRLDDSKAADVRAVQPHGADVGTQIELELEAGEYHLTIRKCFHRDRSTELVVHAPAPEQLRGREAHIRLGHILGSTTDLALWRALRFQQGAVPGATDLRHQTSLAAALDDAAQAALGAEPEAKLVDRAAEEFHRYFTATGRQNIEHTKLIKADESAQARVEELRSAIAGLDRKSVV